MSRKTLISALAGLSAVAGALLLPVTGLASAAEAPTTRPASNVAALLVDGPRILSYDPSGAPQFTDAIMQGAEAWNSSLTSVRLERVQDGRPADITFFSDDAWPYADLQHGRIDIGMAAVNEGHYPPRIVSHELGHILGLPDNRTGRCEDLMSGHSAGPTCTIIYPSPAEAAQVESTGGTEQP